jgi:hypothetical protein
MSERTKKKYLTWHNIRRNEEGDPRDDDKETGRKVVGDYVGHYVPLQLLKIIIFIWTKNWTIVLVALIRRHLK